MLRDGGPGNGEIVGEIADRPLAVAQELHDAPAGRVAERVEYRRRCRTDFGKSPRT